jgi:formate hydrogenlyase subunit 6/NADH:ubiquinone oxidoreductase subunit I
MGSFKLGSMTFKSLFQKPETLLYPLETKPAPAGLKGHIENDVDVCILCGMCQKCCPADAITVEKKERTWGIDPFRCVQCGSCVRACPKHCLSMLPTYTAVAPGKSCRVYEVPDHKAAQKSEAAHEAPAQASSQEKAQA